MWLLFCPLPTKQDLVNLLWAVAKLDFHPTPDLLAAACAAAAPALRRRRLTPGHLSSLLWALATLRYHPGATWLSYWLSASLSDMGSFGPYDISQAMRALAVLQPSRSDADPDGATCLGSSRAGARALSLTETTQPTPGGRLQQLQEVWCRAATRQCVRVLRPGACAPQDVCNALWAAVRLGLDPPAGWAARVAEALLGGANPAINTARTVDVVGLTYALARLAPQQQLQKAVAAQGGRRVAQGLGSRAARRTQGQPAPEKEVKQGVLLVGGMRPVECVLAGPVQLQRLLRALVASTWCMCDQDVANTLWALRQLGVEPSQGLARRLGRRLAELARARAVGPQALSMLLWWCAQQHDRHHHAFQDQQQEQEQQREVLLPSKGMLRRLLRATARRAAQFGPQSATVLLLAAARLHMRDALPLVPLPIPSPAPRLLMPRSRRVAVNGGGGGGSIAAAGSAQGAPCSAAAAEAEEGLAVDQPPPLPYEQLLGAVLRAMEAAAASGGGGGSNSFTPRTLPTVLWAVSRLGYRPPEAWMRAVMGHSVQVGARARRGGEALRAVPGPCSGCAGDRALFAAPNGWGFGVMGHRVQVGASGGLRKGCAQGQGRGSVGPVDWGSVSMAERTMSIMPQLITDTTRWHRSYFFFIKNSYKSCFIIFLSAVHMAQRPFHPCAPAPFLRPLVPVAAPTHLVPSPHSFTWLPPSCCPP